MSSSSKLSPAQLQENHNVEIITVGVVFMTLSTTMVLLRLWSKTMNRSGLGADDVLLVGGWVLSLGQSIMAVSGISYAGVGYHFEALSETQIENFGKVFFASSFVNATALTLSKLSILLLFNRLFVTPTFRMTIRILGAIVIAWWLANFFASLLICEPIYSHWDSTVETHCGNQQAVLVGTPIPWIVTDFAILFAPLPVLKQLHVSRAQKVGLFAIFMVGILTCIVSCYRYSTLFYDVTDATYDITPATVWTIIECNVTVCCAAVMASRSAFLLIYPRKLVSSLQGRWRSYYTGGSSIQPGKSSSHMRIRDDGSNLYGMNVPLKPLEGSGGIKVEHDVAIVREDLSRL